MSIIYNNVPDGLNLTAANVIEVTALGQKRETNFRTDIIAAKPKKTNPILFWSLIGIIVVTLGVAGYMGYQYRDSLKNLFSKGDKIDAIKMKIKKLEEREKHTAIMNMINILRILKKDDVQIRTRLKQEGFDEDEVTSAMETETDDDSEDDNSTEN